MCSARSDADADEHVKAIIAGNGGGTQRVAQSPHPSAARAPATPIDGAPDVRSAKAATVTRGRAL